MLTLTANGAITTNGFSAEAVFKARDTLLGSDTLPLATGKPAKTCGIAGKKYQTAAATSAEVNKSQPATRPQQDARDLNEQQQQKNLGRFKLTSPSESSPSFG